MRFNCPLIVVRDMNRSRKFYETVLGQKVVLDFGENITFDGGFSLQGWKSWLVMIKKAEDTMVLKSHGEELYFEEEDIDGFLEKLKQWPEIEMVHPLHEYDWGQRVIRFYDPDGHIIEVGESMDFVVRRWLKKGLTPEQAAERSQMPLEFVQRCVER